MLKINDSVIIEYPGLAYHQRRGRITGTMVDDFLGKLYIVKVPGYADGFGLPGRCLRPAMGATHAK